MSMIETMQSFIDGIYPGQIEPIPRDEIVVKARQAGLAEDIQAFIEDLPGRSYTRQALVKELNDIIERHGKASEVGGKLKAPEAA